MATENDPLNIAALQSDLAQAGATWTAGPTALTALTPEQRRLMLGADPPDGDAGLDALEADSAAHAGYALARADAPTKVDLKDYCQPVRNQGACGSCVSFGTVAAMEGTARFDAKNAGLAIDLSEAHLFYGHAKAEGRTCSTGWWPDKALTAVRDKGIVDEACCPYTAGDQTAVLCADASERLVHVTSYKGTANVTEMKEWLATKGPMVGCFNVYEDFWAYRTGVYRHQSGDRVGGHCILITGYDDNQRAWLGKNSWGTGWGESGFFRIGYGEVGIDAEMWGVEMPEPESAAWLKRRQVTGLWAIAEERNAAAYLAGVGWKRVGGTSDGDFLAMFNALQSARETKTQVDIRLIDDRIVEVYVF
ncbi:MAG: C1 family peptidase [Jiangellaceae bacterium]